MPYEKVGKDFTWPVTVMLYDDYVALKKCVELNREIFAQKQLVVFGAGIRGSLFAVILRMLGVRGFLFSDNNSEKWGGYIFEHKIVPPSYLEENIDLIVVLNSVEDGGGINEKLTRSGFIENVNLFRVDSNVYQNYIEEMKREIDVETLVVGDCGLSQIAITDVKTDSLATMIRQKFGEEKTKVLAMHGMGMRSFYTAIKIQLKLNPTIKNLILMVNFEVFTGKHHLLPRTQHAELFSMILQQLNLHDDEFLEYVQCVKKRTENFKLDVFSPSNGDGGNSNARLVFYMNYLYTLRKDTEDMQYLFRIIDLVTESKINFLPYIPSVNYEFAQKIVGDIFNYKYNENCKKMTRWIREKDFNVLDLSYLLPADHFAAPNTIDETTNYNGRVKVLNELFKECRVLRITQ